MVAVTSLLGEELHHHGGPIPSVQDQATIPENGVESVNVCGVRLTVDPGPGARTTIGGREERSPSIVYGTRETFRDVR